MDNYQKLEKLGEGEFSICYRIKHDLPTPPNNKVTDVAAAFCASQVPMVLYIKPGTSPTAAV